VKPRCDCAPEARCIPQTYGGEEYECVCKDGYKDTSPDPTNKPGRVCEKKVGGWKWKKNEINYK
jgi:hypothetical protein